MTGAGGQQKAGRAVDDRFRTSDADRDRAAALLREHFAAGCLDAAELDERVAMALNAQTFGELHRVLADLPEAGQAQQQPNRLPPDRGGLERGYRWLLACYPAAYRRVHEEEMLAVLMTAAPSGKQRPGMAEAADLIWGAVRVRCQPSRNGAEPSWRDALAVVSIVLPLIVLTTTALRVIWPLLFVRPVYFGESPLWVLEGFAAPLALLAIALLRQQRAATRTAVALVIGLAYLAVLTYQAGGPDPGRAFSIAGPYVMLAFGLQIVAVTASPGPCRGRQLLTSKHAALAVIAAAAVATTSYPWILVVIPVICAAMALTSSLGRWLLVLLAIPLGPYVATPSLYAGLWGPHVMSLYSAPLIGDAIRAQSPFGANALGPAGQAYVLAAVLLGVFVIAACRESLRSRKLAASSR
jgi:hypothetical protein